MPVPAATIRAMTGDPRTAARARLPGRARRWRGSGGRAAGPGAGGAAGGRRAGGAGAAPGVGVADRTAVGADPPRLRRGYGGLARLAGRAGTGALVAGRVHVDVRAATQLDDGAAEVSVRRRLSALSSFYRYCAAHDLIGRVPTQGVARPVADPDYTATVGLDRGPGPCPGRRRRCRHQRLGVAHRGGGRLLPTSPARAAGRTSAKAAATSLRRCRRLRPS